MTLEFCLTPVPSPSNSSLNTYKSWRDVESKKFWIKNIELLYYTLSVEVLSLELKCLAVEAARQTCLFKDQKKKVSRSLFKTSKQSTHPFGYIATVIWLQDSIMQLQAANSTHNNMHVLLLTQIMRFMADCYVIKGDQLKIFKELQDTDWAKSISDVLQLAEANRWTKLTAAARAAEKFISSINIDWSGYELDIDVVDE